jgi:DNA-binding helix-hairpin-helix protein with protein kinase domain
MQSSSIFFLVFSGVIALVGLFTAAAAEADLHNFGLALMFFGLLFAYSVVKRHFDRQAH